jgi:hypothetical protein
VDSSGNVYVADYSNNLIRKIDSSGNVTTLAGGGSDGGTTSGNADGEGTAATFSNPNGIALDSSGNLYVADYANNLIRKITTSAAATIPSVSSIAPAGSPAANATSLSFTVVFSEAVSGVDASDFTLSVMSMSSLTGTIGTPTSSDGITWTVPISGISGDGVMRLDLNSSGTGIAATATGNTAINGGYTSGTTHTVNVPPAVNAACGSADGVATAFIPGANLCTSGSASAVTVGTPWTWTCNGSGGGIDASCSAPNQTTGGGTGRALITGDAWVIDPAQSAGFMPTSGHIKSPPSLPTGYTFPYGLFDFTLITGAPSSTATITITYPAAIPAGAVYWKYGPSPAGYNCTGVACGSAHWYQMPPSQAVIAGNTVTLTITDGGVGDDDLVANSVIVDQGGPGVPAGVAGIPTLSEWGLISLFGLMGLFGVAQVRRRKDDSMAC